MPRFAPSASRTVRRRQDRRTTRRRSQGWTRRRARKDCPPADVHSPQTSSAATAQWPTVQRMARRSTPQTIRTATVLRHPQAAPTIPARPRSAMSSPRQRPVRDGGSRHGETAVRGSAHGRRHSPPARSFERTPLRPTTRPVRRRASAAPSSRTLAGSRTGAAPRRIASARRAMASAGHLPSADRGQAISGPKHGRATSISPARQCRHGTEPLLNKA